MADIFDQIHAQAQPQQQPAPGTITVHPASELNLTPRPVAPGVGIRTGGNGQPAGDIFDQIHTQAQAQQPGLLSTLWNEGVVNPAKQVTAGALDAAAGANHLTANAFDLLDKAADAISAATGMTKGGAFRHISDWARGNEQAQERQAQQLSGGRTDLASQIYRGGTQGVLSIPTAAVAATAAGPVAGFALLGALQESDKGWVPALMAAAEGAFMGGALQVMGPASRPIRLTGMSATTYAQARLNGDDNATALAKATTMGAMAAAPSGGATTGDILSANLPKIVKVKSTLNPVEQQAADYAQGNNIRLSPGTITGNKGIQSLEAVTQASPLGAQGAAEFRRGTETDLQRNAATLADQASPLPATPESVGRAVPASMDRTIAGLAVPRDAAYAQAWQGRDDPAYTYNVPVRTEEVPVLGTDGNPTGQTETKPILKPVNMPVDLRDVKEAAQPIYDTLKWRLAPAEQNASAGFNALEKILKSDDFIPAWQAESGLSALKSMARLEPSEGVRDISQGIGAHLVPTLQEGIDNAVANTGDDALAALRQGRQLHSQIMDVEDVASKLRDKEPVRNFGRLMQPKDAAVDFLRAVQNLAPEQMEPLGRAWVQGEIERATREGGFSKTQGLLNDWRDLGDQTKQIAFPDPDVRAALGNLFKVADMVSHTPNPSGTALVSSATSLNPMRWAAGYLGSKLFFTPTGISLLTRSLAEGPGGRSGGSLGAPPETPGGGGNSPSAGMPGPGGEAAGAAPIPPSGPRRVRIRGGR